MTGWRPIIAAGAGVVLLALAGCGDGKSGDSDGAASTTAVTSVFTGQGSEEFCRLARDYNDKSAAAFIADSFSLAANPNDDAVRNRFRANLEESLRLGREIQAKAPPEIAPDFGVLIEGSDRYFQALQRSNFNLSDPAANEVLTEPAFVQAQGRFMQYLVEVCKLNIGAPVTSTTAISGTTEADDHDHPATTRFSGTGSTIFDE